MLSTPLVYIVFNRPRQTIQTFAAIRAQRPSRLLIIADGPRPGHPTDAGNCAEVRRIVSEIDWPCEVLRNLSEVNLGCKRRVVTGLDWAFENVERAIIIEDDCLPHPDFYPFCETLLERYENDPRVMVITGDNFQDGRRRGPASYYFSKFNHVWGWATWRRAWQLNDASMRFWPGWKTSGAWEAFIPDALERQYWSEIFESMYRQEIDTWDYSWAASVWYHGGLTATPKVNLVENIGFGPDATHTALEEHQPCAPASPLGSIFHPPTVVRDVKADRYLFDHHFGGINRRFHRRLLRLPLRIGGKIRDTFTGRAAEQHG
jgi:hypothetical protein